MATPQISKSDCNNPIKHMVSRLPYDGSMSENIIAWMNRTLESDNCEEFMRIRNLPAGTRLTELMNTLLEPEKHGFSRSKLGPWYSDLFVTVILPSENIH